MPHSLMPSQQTVTVESQLLLLLLLSLLLIGAGVRCLVEVVMDGVRARAFPTVLVMGGWVTLILVLVTAGGRILVSVTTGGRVLVLATGRT